MANYPVTASADDRTEGDGANTNGLQLVATFNNVAVAYSYGTADIDTSAIGTDYITDATLYWYHDAYLKTKSATFSRVITVGQLPNIRTIFSDTSTPAAAGWHSHALTAGELFLINKFGDTRVTFLVDDPGPSKSRTWQIASWDYNADGSRACYLAVTHSAGGPTIYSILR